MKYFVHTFGCQMNYSDTERIAAVLESMGFKPATNEKDADLMIWNTCSVRKKAEDKVYGKMSDLIKVRVLRPKLIVGVTGCMIRKTSTKKSIKRDKVVLHKAVDITFKIDEVIKLPSLIREVRPEIKLRKLAAGGDEIKNYFAIKPKRESKKQVWIPIQTGCDKFCTYCIVPFARGREHSRPMNEIFEECENAVKNGALEITLIGQTVDSYGLSVKDKLGGEFTIKSEIPNVVFNKKIFKKDDRKNCDKNGEDRNVMASGSNAVFLEKAERPFITLLRKIDKLHEKGLRSLRFISPHPQDFSTDLILLHKELKTLKPYIHLPVQAGSNSVLERMRRTYTREHYLNLIGLVKKHLGNGRAEKSAAISTDIIVGFPGETEEDFMETYKLMEEVRWDMAFLAIYSPRPGTYSAQHLKDDVPRRVKSERFTRLNDLLAKISREKNEAWVGKTVEVLVEKSNMISANGGKQSEIYRYSGRTPHFKQVFFESGKNITGEFVKVRIKSAENFFLVGELI